MSDKLSNEQIDAIANDGHRNAAGGIYATSVHAFAREIEHAVLAASPAPFPAEPMPPFGWVQPRGGNYFTRSEVAAKRIGGLMPVYASPAPASTWPGYKRGFSDGQRAANRIHAQRAAPAAADAWVQKAVALPTAPGWYLVMLEPDNDWGLMSDTPLQVEFDALTSKPREFTCIYDWRTDEVITSAVTHWMPMPAAPGDAAPKEKQS